MQIRIEGRTVWLNFHHLYYFHQIALTGSIARASEILRVGQPTLSAQLKQFEESIDVALFDRTHKKLTLTPIGRTVMDHANDIFRIGEDLVEAIHAKKPERIPRVRIGALDSVPKHLVVELAKAAREGQPCAVSILEGKPDELLRELMNSQVDLVLSNFLPAEVSESGLYSKRVTRVPVIVCGAKKYRNLSNGFPASLDQQPFILPTVHSRLRHEFDHLMRLEGIRPHVVAETQDTAIQKLMGVEGWGVLPVPLPAVRTHLEEGSLYEIGRLKGVWEDVYLISISRKTESPIASSLMRNFRLDDDGLLAQKKSRS